MEEGVWKGVGWLEGGGWPWFEFGSSSVFQNIRRLIFQICKGHINSHEIETAKGSSDFSC